MTIRCTNHAARTGCFLLVLLTARVMLPRTTAAATITIVNVDGAGEGFNDPTPVAPVGGNTGTTLGQQRLNVFVQAASIWGSILPSNVTIRVRSSFDPLTCNASSGVLGAASSIGIARNFPNAPVAGTWYHMALANKLAGVDLDPANNDIQAFFNSNINVGAGCLGGSSWYYGFDGNEGTNIELLPVVLHELAHGLGFSTFADESTGALLSGAPDIYTRFMLDTDLGLTWNQMTDAQRRVSAVNSFGLVWNGPAVTTMAPILLGLRPRLLVNTPAAIAGTYTVSTAAFGAALTTAGVTGAVVLAADNTGTSSDACEPMQNNVAGKIALIDRGTCTFVTKATNAQNAGAIGVIIANNVVASSPPSLGGSAPGIGIPVVGITQADGNTLKSQLGLGVNATIGLDATQLAGADAAAYGVSIFGSDALLWHSYTDNLLWETSQHEAMGSFNYEYLGHHFFSASRELWARQWTGGDNNETTTLYDRTTDVQWASMLPWLQSDRRLYLGIGAALQTTDRVQIAGLTSRAEDERVAAAFLRYDTRDSNWYADGINRGNLSTLLYESYRPFNSHYDGHIVRFDTRGYLPLGKTVLSARWTEARAQDITEPFYLGGSFEHGLTQAPMLNQHDLPLRGYRGGELELRGQNARTASISVVMGFLLLFRDVDVDADAKQPPSAWVVKPSTPSTFGGAGLLKQGLTYPSPSPTPGTS